MQLYLCANRSGMKLFWFTALIEECEGYFFITSLPFAERSTREIKINGSPLSCLI
jgi:hypothetical protein